VGIKFWYKYHYLNLVEHFWKGGHMFPFFYYGSKFYQDCWIIRIGVYL
jgi:hypothetical protein